MIDVNPNHLETVTRILAGQVPECEVRAFGSRVTWTAKDYSDLDLAVVGDRALDSDALRLLKEAFEESDLPFRVDVLDWYAISPAFQKVIEKKYEVVQKGKKKSLGMAGERQTIPFERLLTEPVRNGIYKPKEFHGRGAKIVNMGELFVHPRLRAVPMKRVELSPSETERFMLAEGDLIFARRSLTAEGAGKCSVVLDLDEPTTFESSIIRARPDRLKAEPLYLYYFFNSAAGFHSLDTIRRQVAVAGITGSDLSRLEIPVPRLPEQRAIAHILGTLDDKIELNRRMNETLEAMARALFKSWFVDFDPVRAKMEGRDPGLPQLLADLFPDSFENSELGEIPKGWQVGRLDDVLVLQRGFDLPATERTPGPYPVIAASGPNGTHNQSMVRGPGVTTGRSGVLGNVFYVHDDFWPLNTSLWVKDFKRSTPAYAFHLLRRLDFAVFNAGSAVPTLNRNHVHNLPTLIPPIDLVHAFETVAVLFLKRQRINDDESHTLAALRDTLLPKLISGELRVPFQSDVATKGPRHGKDQRT